jgi:serine protease Do
VASLTVRKTIQPSPSTGFDFGPFGGQGVPIPRGPRIAEGNGSGFIVSEDGWIMTNDHVVSGADRVTVELDDGREFTGDVRRDYRSDIALVKIDATGLKPLKFADSGKVEIGQWAIAFGSPFGLQDSMTVGIVSALGRETAIGGRGDAARFYPNLLQTDASINPGNSGGPLVDVYGQVVGVNVAIGSPTGASVGIGFAIPADSAKYVMEQLIAKGSVTRGFLGFAPERLSPSEQQRYGVNEGVLVVSVTEDSPADRAGLQVEDVITKIDSTDVTNEAQLRDLIARTPPGQKLTLTVVRGGQVKTLPATVENMPEQPGAASVPSPTPPQQERGKLGIQIGDLNAEVARQLKMDPSAKGAVVVGVQPGSAAQEAGVMPGDIVLRVGERDTTTATQVMEAVTPLKAGDSVPIVVRREGSRILLRAQIR